MMYVLGAALNVSRLKCVEHIDQWSLFFMIFIYLVFLTAENIPGPTKMDMSIWESNREGAYNKLHTVTIEL